MSTCRLTAVPAEVSQASCPGGGRDHPQPFSRGAQKEPSVRSPGFAVSSGAASWLVGHLRACVSDFSKMLLFLCRLEQQLGALFTLVMGFTPTRGEKGCCCFWEAALPFRAGEQLVPCPEGLVTIWISAVFLLGHVSM